MSLFLKVILALIFWGFWVFVLFQIPYPKSLTEASPFVILSFFAPLFLSLIFTFDLFLKFILRSILISFLIIILLILKGLDLLNLITGTALLLTAALSLIYSKKKSLTSNLKIPRLKALRRK